MKRLALLLLLVSASGVAADVNPELDAAFPQGNIVISASRNACYSFDVYFALNAAQWQRGLMHVRNLDDWRGMLFIYPGEDARSMWMKNTFIPLDMLFIRANGTISSIVKNTEPQSLASIASREPVRFVLELNAGVTDALDINAGDEMVFAGDIAPVPSQD